MKHLLALLVLLATGPSAFAQILISDFSDLAAQTYTPYNLSWNYNPTPQVSVDQVVQNNGFVSITPVDGGNPTGTGSFDGVLQGFVLYPPPQTPFMTVSFVGVVNLQLTVRVDSGNTDSSFKLTISDSNDVAIGQATFSTPSPTSGFSTLTASFHAIPGGGNPADATFWDLSGDSLDGPDTTNVRLSLDSLYGLVPEPSTYLLTFAGFLVLIFLRVNPWKRSAALNVSSYPAFDFGNNVR